MAEYRVVTRGDVHQVVVVSDGRELPATQPTRDPGMAAYWCTTLRRAAATEEERRRQAKGA